MIIACLHFILYILLSKRAISQAKKRIDEFLSNYNLTWLNSILNGLLIILLVSVLGNLFQLNQSPLYFQIALPLLILIMTLFILNLFWRSLNVPFIWLIEDSASKYEKNKVQVTESEIIEKKLLQALEQDKVYLDPDIKLKDLAEKIGHPARNVSQVINEGFDKSFFNLINSFRIEEAKIKFRNNQD